MALLKDTFVSMACFMIIPGMSGCTSADRLKATEPSSINVSLQQLWAEPERFADQTISLTVYAKPVFGIGRFDRYDLLQKAEDGTCDGVPFRSYSFGYQDIRKGHLPAKTDFGYEVSLTGQFHLKEIAFNPGTSIDITYDGFLTDVMVHRLPGLCQQRH